MTRVMKRAAEVVGVVVAAVGIAYLGIGPLLTAQPFEPVSLDDGIEDPADHQVQ